MGTGDEIPSVLQSVGLNTNIITPQDLASGELSRYGTVVSAFAPMIRGQTFVNKTAACWTT